MRSLTIFLSWCCVSAVLQAESARNPVADPAACANAIARSAFAEAETCTRSLLAKDPNNRDAKEQLARILAWQGKYAEAHAIADHYPDSAGWILRGQLFWYEGRHQESVQAYKKALKLDPKAPAQAELKKAQEAVKAEKKGQAYFPALQALLEYANMQQSQNHAIEETHGLFAFGRNIYQLGMEAWKVERQQERSEDPSDESYGFFFASRSSQWNLELRHRETPDPEFSANSTSMMQAEKLWSPTLLFGLGLQNYRLPGDHDWIASIHSQYNQGPLEFLLKFFEGMDEERTRRSGLFRASYFGEGYGASIFLAAGYGDASRSYLIADTGSSFRSWGAKAQWTFWKNTAAFVQFENREEKRYSHKLWGGGLSWKP